MADSIDTDLIWIPLFLLFLLMGRFEVHFGLQGGDAPVQDVAAPAREHGCHWSMDELCRLSAKKILFLFSSWRHICWF